MSNDDGSKAVMGQDGNTDNYFGGSDGTDDGPGHGHVSVTPTGDVTYAREAAQHMPDATRAERVSVNEPEPDNSSQHE